MYALVLTSTSSANAGLLTDWNLVVTGDLYAGHNVQGAVRVGGDLYVRDTFEAAARSGSLEKANPSLLVGGDVVTANRNPESIKVLQGNAVIGGSINNSTDHKTRIVSTRNGGTLNNDPQVSTVGSSDHQQLKADSTAFRKMAGSEQSISLPTRQVETAAFTVKSVDVNGNAVFTVDAETLFENPMVRGFKLDLNGFRFSDGTSIVFNVSGVDIDFRNGLNFDGAFRNVTSNIIWNFFEATNIDLGRTDFYGSLIAPDAILTNSNRINGSVFAKALGTNNDDGMQAAVKLPGYSGYVPSRYVSTPEPSSFVMAGAAIVSGLIWRRSRRRG